MRDVAARVGHELMRHVADRRHRQPVRPRFVFVARGGLVRRHVAGLGFQVAAQVVLERQRAARGRRVRQVRRRARQAVQVVVVERLLALAAPARRVSRAPLERAVAAPGVGVVLDRRSGARRGGSGVRASGQAAEQRHRRGSSPGGCGSGAGALPGFRADIRAREAGGGARSSAVGGDAAPVDDRGWPVAREGAAGDAGASESAAAGVRGGPGADRRLAARLVRGSRAGVRADRVRRRRDCWRRGSSPRRRPRRTWRRRGRIWRPTAGRWRTTRTATACSGSTRRTRRTS